DGDIAAHSHDIGEAIANVINTVLELFERFFVDIFIHVAAHFALAGTDDGYVDSVLIHRISYRRMDHHSADRSHHGISGAINLVAHAGDGISRAGSLFVDISVYRLAAFALSE